MGNKILTFPGYQTMVRAKLGVSIGDVPDATIDQLIYVGAAEAKVAKRVPDYATLTGDDLTYLQTATVCTVAAIMAPDMKALIKAQEKGPEIEIRLQDQDWDAKQKQLYAEADMWIRQISTYKPETLTPFIVTGPSRVSDIT